MIAKEVENWVNEEEDEDPEPILGHPISVNEDYLGEIFNIKIVSDPEEK